MFTINDVLMFLKKKFKFHPDTVSCENIVIYNKYSKYVMDIDQDVETLYMTLNRSTSSYIHISFVGMDEKYRPIITPLILYKWDA